MTRAACLLFLVVVGSACGREGKVCDPSSCRGCCDADGECRDGASPAACGTNGFECVACLEQQTCQFGICLALSAGGGGGGVDGGCQPTTCEQAAKNCGSIDNGCGAIVECDTCSSDETCGGSGIPNVCGKGTCQPKTCADLNKNCGTVSDGCSMSILCGTCSGQDVCGSDKVCAGTCVPKQCSEVGASCGHPADGCQNTLDCGDCTGRQTCGGAGTPFTCGATCTKGCPPHFSCDAEGVCVGNSNIGIVLNVVQLPKVAVSGTVTLNGALPTSDCSSSVRATVQFTNAQNPNYNTTFEVPCNGGTSPFDFSGELYPATYDVNVKGGLSNLPPWTVVVVDALLIK